MNLYVILGVSSTASSHEIRVAYRKGALKYHPDKCKLEGAREKFQNIQMAYEILIDPYKRQEYDIMPSDQQLQLYDSLRDYMVSKFPYYSQIVNILYINENDLRADINNLNFNNIFEKIKGKIGEYITNITIRDSTDNVNADIIGDLYVSLADKYMNKYSKI